MVARQGGRRLGRVAAGLAATVAATTAMGLAGQALAISGERADSVGIFRVTGASCDAIRFRTGVDGDVFFSCDPNGEACDIDLPDTNRETRSGIAATAFCADTFPPGPTPIVDPGVIKPDVSIVGSSFSGITGIKADTGVDTEAANIVCSTFSLGAVFQSGGVNSGPGVRACRKILPGAGPGPTCSNEQAEYFVTQSDSCTDVAALIDGAVGVSPTLAWVLFTDVDPSPGSVGQPGRQALLVCPGYTWQCVDETNRSPTDTVIDYRVPLGVLQEDPDCYVTTKGYRYPRPPCR